MKKYFNKKSLILIIALIYVFFTGFKFFKGKSFFDTILEYTNNIHSINADIVDATRDNYSLLNFEYIPIKYTDYKEASFGRYIVRKENTNNLYIYEPILETESLFIEIDKSFTLHDVIVEGNWVVWLESSDDILDDELQKSSWRIYTKIIGSSSKILIDQGTINSNKGEQNINFIPREFDLDGNTLIYTKGSENTIDKNNIITTTVMTSIVMCNLESKKNEIIAMSYNNYKEELSDIKIDGNNIIWQKKYKDIKNGQTTKVEVYKYSINNAVTEKIFETSDVYMIDIKGENIVIVLKNPDDNILIYNLQNKFFTNIFYKGSKVEKLFRIEKDIPIIMNIEFITPEKLFIGISSKKSDISTLIYDLNLEQFLNYDKIIESVEDVPLIQYGINKNKLLAYVGIIKRNISVNNEKDLYSENEDMQIKKSNVKEIFIDTDGIDATIEEDEKKSDEKSSQIEEKQNFYYKYFEYLLR